MPVQDHHENPSLQACVAMFARTPVLGKVKTRLASVLGEQGALDLYVQMLTQQIKMLNGCQLAARQLWVEGDREAPLFSSFKGETFTQSGADLGARMKHAAGEALKEHASVVLIGSDCPSLDAEYLERALHLLDEPATDIVLGPALDGGYVLIGMRRIYPALFEGIDWGSEKVLQQTIDKIQHLGLTCRTLEALQDIDRPADLKTLL